jgi:hypothetical protein
MRSYPWGSASVALALLLATSGIALGQALPMEPTHNRGQSVTAAFEGWFPNADGTFSILIGYFNRNLQASVDIPIGPENQIMPGGPDRGQPTHFLPGRGWGYFTVTVPKDFGTKQVVWTLTVNGVTTTVPLNLNILWRIAPFVDATGDTPAFVGFSETGPFVNGPIGQSESITATAGAPTPITVWVADDAKSPVLPGLPVATSGPGGPGGGGGEERSRQPVSTRWTVYRGPGSVLIEKDLPQTEKIELKNPPPGTVFDGKITNTITFSQPGNYILSVQIFDSTGEGGHGFQCCWTNSKINVTVQAAAATSH